jgi:hypothetical protein
VREWAGLLGGIIADAVGVGSILQFLIALGVVARVRRPPRRVHGDGRP